MINARILGLDISSTTIGYCVLDIINDQIKLVAYDFYKPSKDGHILERLSKTKKVFQKLLKEYQPTAIAIEDIVQFMAGASSAKTIITLASFNRMLGLLSYEYLKELPQLYSVMAIRHGLKLDKVLPAKEEMPILIEHHLNIQFNYLYKKNGTIRPETYDMADACSVATHAAQKMIANSQPKVKKNNVKKRSL